MQTPLNIRGGSTSSAGWGSPNPLASPREGLRSSGSPRSPEMARCEASLQLLVTDWYRTSYLPHALASLTWFFTQQEEVAGFDPPAYLAEGLDLEKRWVARRTDRRRFPQSSEEGKGTLEGKEADKSDGSRAVAVLLPSTDLHLDPPLVVSQGDSKDALKAADKQSCRAPFYTRHRLLALYHPLPEAPNAPMQQRTLIPACTPALALLLSVWHKLFEDKAQRGEEGAGALKALAAAAAAGIVMTKAAKVWADAKRSSAANAADAKMACRTAVSTLRPLQSAAVRAVGLYDLREVVAWREREIALLNDADSALPAACESTRACAALARTALGEARTALGKARAALDKVGTATKGLGAASESDAMAPFASARISMDSRVAEATCAVQVFLAEEAKAHAAAAAALAEEAAAGSRSNSAGGGASPAAAAAEPAPSPATALPLPPAAAPGKILLRPLFAIAAAFEANPAEPFGPRKQKEEEEEEARVFNVLLLFCSACVPPGKAVLEAFRPHLGTWSKMLSRQGGLWSFLRFGSLKPTTQVSTATHSIEQRARVAFLHAMEMQHQMFARCSLPELGELQTANQTFKATVEVETITLFPSDFFWTWRDLMPEPKRGEAKGGEEEEEEHVRNLLPSNWSIRHDVHRGKFYESDPCNWAIRTKFNKVVIGADRQHDSVTLSLPLNREATGHLGGPEGVLSFQQIEASLLLARLVPEAAGDPWTKEGRESICSSYTLVRSTQTFSSTFDCMLNLASFPADMQRITIDISSEFLFFFTRFLHHQNTAYDAATSAFHAWDPLGPSLSDRSMFTPMLALTRHMELHTNHERVRELDLNSIWMVDAKGHRKGDRLGVQWSEAQVSSEWLEPRWMDDEPHNVYLSSPTLNRTHSEYSHQKFTLTLMRKMEHCECEGCISSLQNLLPLPAFRLTPPPLPPCPRPPNQTFLCCSCPFLA